jgi:glycerol-3-phosphate dehydrogenase
MDWRPKWRSTYLMIMAIALGLCVRLPSQQVNGGHFTARGSAPFIPVRNFSLLCDSHDSDRLHSDIEAEVVYAVRYEYAQTAIDVLARRTRLSFLNARAALESLPRVVDIMASELNWSRAQKKAQIEQAVSFLSSMGLAPEEASVLPESEPVGLLERMAWRLGGIWGGVSKVRMPVEYSRAQFEAGEVDALRQAFEKKASVVYLTDASGIVEEMRKVRLEALVEIIKDIPGYEDIAAKDYDYALQEAGFAGRVDIDLDEFIEVGAVLSGAAFAHAV